MGAHDGTGFRTVVFLQGCPNSCIYCHNPDTWAASGGEGITEKELFSRVMRYYPYFKRTGGVTVSGGEPLLQTDFCIAFFDLLKGAGVHTCLDTSGTLVTDRTKRLLELSDLVLLDIKHFDRDGFMKLTGSPSARYDDFLKFYRLCKDLKKELVLRQVKVPGYTDGPEYAKKLKELYNDKIEFLEFHDMGREKWQRSGLDYKF